MTEYSSEATLSKEENDAAADAPPLGSMLAIALAWAEAGYRIFPVHNPIIKGDLVTCSCGKSSCIKDEKVGKHPRVNQWQNVATADVAQIKAWWTEWPNANIGLPTGTINGLSVIDIDPRNGGQDSWHKLLRRHRDRPPITKIVETGSGGDHWLFTYIEGLGSNAGVVGDGIDIRSDGGYVLAAGSLHASGKRYVGSLVGPDTVECAPDWLIEEMCGSGDGRRKGQGGRKQRRKNGRTDIEQLRCVLGTIDKGSRDSELAYVAGSLWHDGIDEARLQDLLKQWAERHLSLQKPGAVKRVATSIKKYERDPAASIEVDDIDDYLRAKLERAEARGSITIADFWSYLPRGSYIFGPTREPWPGGSVDAKVERQWKDPQGKPFLNENGEPRSMAATAWLDQYQSVEQMTWAPGQPEIIEDQYLVEGGWIDRHGARCYNLYIPPVVQPGDATKAEKWVEHVKLVYPDEAEHIIDWLAHRVQRPEDKINHALVLAGGPGIGKDTILEPIKHAIGAWNFQEVGPKQVYGRFNGFLKGVILRVSEARDLGEWDRFALYETMKTYTAAPPDVLRCDEKNLREHKIINVCGVIITSNYKTDGIYLPADDRRHFVAWSDREKEDDCFQNDYWNDLWSYYKDGGSAAVAAFLMERDIRGFDAKAPPPKTEAFWAIVGANCAPEESELADALDALGNPEAVTLDMLVAAADGELCTWLRERRNCRAIPHRLEKCGYVPVRNPDAKSGWWVVDGKRQAVYAKKSLPLKNRILAARKVKPVAKPAPKSENPGIELVWTRGEPVWTREEPF